MWEKVKIYYLCKILQTMRNSALQGHKFTQIILIMKKIMAMFAGICCVACAWAQPRQTIELNAPDKSRGEATMQAFDKRHSTREFSVEALKLQDLSDLVWAANGYNRPAEKKRTAPTAQNKQEIDLYVILPEGAYLYDPAAHALRLVVGGDLRPQVAGTQAFAATAPVCLLIVADMARVNPNDTAHTWAAVDAGIVSQNISIFCAGCGFATVPRGFMDKDALGKSLKLSSSQVIFLNHPVGYFK